jgi:hypothetical protein
MQQNHRGHSAWLAAHAFVQLVVLALSCTPARDPDLGFHLATGRAVLALGRVPARNILSFAEPGAEAINQQWLPAVAFELAYQAFGIAGPTLLKMLLLAATFALVLDTARVLGARPSAATLTSVLGIWAAAPRFVERPLLFSNLCIAVVAHCIALRYRDREATRLTAAPFVLAGSATALAVQLHAGAVFAFGLLLLAAGAHLASCFPLLRNLSPEAARRPFAEALVWLATAATAFGSAALALSLYHPYGLRVLTVPFSMATDPFLYTVLIEFRAPWAFGFEMLAAYWAFCALSCLALVVMFRRTSLTISLTMAFGLALSLRHSRFIDLASVLAMPGLSLAASKLLSRASEPRRAERAFQVLAGVSGVVILLLVALHGRFGFGYEPASWPIQLMRDARALGLTGPAFVQDGWAGPYLAFRYPAERVFFHPAFDAYSQSFFRDVYMRTRDGEPGWDDALNRHGVRLVLMKYTSINERKRQAGRPNLRQRLAHDRRWALVSFDSYGLVFVRRAGVHSRAARAAIIEGFDPDRATFLRRPSLALAGLRNLNERGLHSALQKDALRAAEQSP